jgi:hypothetical protein
MPDNPPSLSITTDKVCFLIVKAREFDVKDAVTDPGDASNATDDLMIAVLEDHRNDPVAAEIRSFIDALNEDEQIDLVALAWLGRGEAARAHNKRTAAYLLGTPLIADLLEEGLAAFGQSCEEFEMGRL